MAVLCAPNKIQHKNVNNNTIEVVMSKQETLSSAHPPEQEDIIAETSIPQYINIVLSYTNL